MRRLSLLCLAVLVSACGADTPAAPTPAPIPAASIASSGTLNLTGCLSLSSTTFSCSFNGIATNDGAGCASNVRGSTIGRDTAGTQIGTAQWSYSATVRPGERIVYSGFGLTVPNGNWTYNTQIAWDNVRCP